MTSSSNQDVPLSGQPATGTTWHYAVDGQRMGPVTREQLAGMLAGGQISPHTPVWREGMADWLAASQVGELAAAMPAAAPPMTSPVPTPATGDKAVRNAKQNCIAMFVIFVGVLVLSVLAVASRFAGRVPLAAPLGCFAWAAPLAAIFAAIYLPLRWRVIMQLSPAVRTMGLIGGFGLIGLFLLGLLGWLAGVALG